VTEIVTSCRLAASESGSSAQAGRGRTVGCGGQADPGHCRPGCPETSAVSKL
jgi:hypothetical protein